MVAGMTRTAVAVTILGFGLGISGAAAQTTDVAHVVTVQGFVLAGSSERPALLEVLDPIRDRTRIDLPANSELRICHYPTHTTLILRGPTRAEVSARGLAVENVNAVDSSREPCGQPAMATVQGGLMTRAPRLKN
jgi:hypothetical protein